MQLIKVLPTYGETKLLVKVRPHETMVFMISSSGISTHKNEDHIQYCLDIGTFEGHLDVTRATLPLAYELLQLDLPEYARKELEGYMVDWQIDYDNYGYMDEPKAPVLEILADKPGEYYDELPTVEELVATTQLQVYTDSRIYAKSLSNLEPEICDRPTHRKDQFGYIKRSKG